MRFIGINREQMLRRVVRGRVKVPLEECPIGKVDVNIAQDRQSPGLGVGRKDPAWVPFLEIEPICRFIRNGHNATVAAGKGSVPVDLPCHWVDIVPMVMVALVYAHHEQMPDAVSRGILCKTDKRLRNGIEQVLVICAVYVTACCILDHNITERTVQVSRAGLVCDRPEARRCIRVSHIDSVNAEHPAWIRHSRGSRGAHGALFFQPCSRQFVFLLCPQARCSDKQPFPGVTRILGVVNGYWAIQHRHSGVIAVVVFPRLVVGGLLEGRGRHDGPNPLGACSRSFCYIECIKHALVRGEKKESFTSPGGRRRILVHVEGQPSVFFPHQQRRCMSRICQFEARISLEEIIPFPHAEPGLATREILVWVTPGIVCHPICRVTLENGIVLEITGQRGRIGRREVQKTGFAGPS